MNKSIVFRSVTVMALLFLVATSAATAQETRAALIAAEQAKKAARVSEEGPTGVERLVTRLTLPRRPIYPWFGSVYRGAGFAAGLKFGVGSTTNTGRVEFTGAMSVRNTPMADVTWRLTSPGARVVPTIQVRSLKAKGLRFFGVGEASQPDPTTYGLTQHLARASVDVALRPGVFLTGAVGYRGISTEDLPAPFNVGTRLDFLEASLGARLDWRPAPGYATRGGLLRGEWTHRQATDNRPNTFTQVEGEYIQLVPFHEELFVLAFRALATASLADGEDVVPYIFLPEVGSGHTVRGFTSGRFRDRSRLVFSGEYRWRPSRVIDMALFVDHGASVYSLRDVNRDRFVTAWGAGIRFHTPADTVFRFDMAHSREGWRAVFSTSQVF